jgi:hypothetical protein
MAIWADIKEQARTMLGLGLSDVDVADIPKLATDQYGRFLRGPSGLPQYETAGVRVFSPPQRQVGGSLCGLLHPCHGGFGKPE